VRDAEAAISRAAALAPADVAVLVAAIHFHLAAPEPVRTHVLEWYVRRAAALIGAHQCPPEAWHALVVARGLQLEGALEASESFYRQALSEDSRQEGIRQWIPPGALVTMRTSQAKKELTDPVVWASGKSTYQTLGLLAGVTGTLAASQQKALLDNDPRLQAIVTLGRAENDAMRAAVQLLKQIPEQLVTPGDHMLMAELDRRQGQVAGMVKHYQAAMQHDLTDDDLRRIADVMLVHNALPEASRAIDRLERQRVPEDSSFSLRLRWLKAQQKTDQMLRLAEDTVRPAAGHALRMARANVAAELLASAGRAAEARGLLELACRRHQDRDQIVAGWLAKQSGNADEVMKRCADLESAGELEQAASLAVVCLLHGTSSEDVAARTEALVSGLLNQGETVSTQLLVNLSRLREIQGRIDDAISMGRKAIELERANPAVQNNMAWYSGAYKGDHDAALESINRAIRTAGPLDPFLDTKAVVLLAAGYPEQAIPLLELAAAGQTAPSTIHLHLAAAYHAAGRTADARIALEVARQRNPTVVVPFDRELEKRLDAELKDAKKAG
jgi:tetratricopeptide (TPR) repeat protein